MIGAHELELLPVSVALDGGAEAPDVDITCNAVGYDLRLHGVAVRIPRTATVTVHYEAGHASANAGEAMRVSGARADVIALLQRAGYIPYPVNP